MEIDFFQPIKLNNPLKEEEYLLLSSRLVLMDDLGNFLFIYPKDSGYLLRLCHDSRNGEEPKVLGELFASSKEELDNLLQSHFIGYVTTAEYERLSELTKEASFDLIDMFSKKFPGREEAVGSVIAGRYKENLGILMDEDFGYAWSDKLYELAPEEAKDWSDDYKEIIANFYYEVFDDVCNAVYGVKTDRYNIMGRIEQFGYVQDDDTPDPVFSKGEVTLVFDNYVEAEKWVEEQERLRDGDH